MASDLRELGVGRADALPDRRSDRRLDAGDATDHASWHVQENKGVPPATAWTVIILDADSNERLVDDLRMLDPAAGRQAAELTSLPRSPISTAMHSGSCERRSSMTAICAR